MARFITGVGEKEVGWAEWRSPCRPTIFFVDTGEYAWWVGVALAPWPTLHNQIPTMKRAIETKRMKYPG